MPQLGNNEESRSYGIEITVNNYYTDFTAKEDLMATLYKPVGDFITGGGFIHPVNPNPPVGLYPSDEGTRTNFGFNVRFNKNGKNLKGRMNFIWRTQNGRIFQARSNAIESLGVDISDPENKIAVFVAKCNVRDLSPNSQPIPNSGNVSMFVTMVDRGEPGSNDQIGFTLWNGNQLWYSSNWVNTKTEELLLSGGNLIVHSGFSSNNKTSEEETTPFGPANRKPGMEVTAFPNPFSDATTISIELPEPGNVKLFISNQNGQVVSVLHAGDLPGGTHNFELNAGSLASGVYYYTVISNQGIASRKLLITR